MPYFYCSPVQHSILDCIYSVTPKFYSMKWLFLFLAVLACQPLFAQHTEDEIRKLEDLERQAVLKGDSVALFNRYWSPGMVVNTPANRVGTVEGTKAAQRTGKLDYATFE